MMDGLPGLVHAVVRAVASAEPEMDPEAEARTAEVAADHGRRRAAGGFPIAAVLAEFRELHTEVLTHVWRLADEVAESGAGQPPRAMLERLASTIGDLGAAAADAWVAATERAVAGSPARVA
jgi:hypothetical protein